MSEAPCFAPPLNGPQDVVNFIIKSARVYVRHIKRSLGQVNVIASIIFAGISGSAVADTSGLGLVEISIPLVIYAVIAEQSVGRLFLGGVILGLLMGFALATGGSPVLVETSAVYAGFGL
ncbi:MAG: hypothetical protein PWR06_2065 [Thermoanaerobacteraceae bacterium]|nr:hypothetical protein [Thermoanaerobacteraceae bacterium]MDN5312274.1 hypothetical protein [Thermoanaerobacteraceae bacterium]